MYVSLLDFLVTSQTRRELLRLLWAENLESSAHQLALLVGGAYSSVYEELASMQNEGLVTSRRHGKAVMFKKNERYASSRALKTLLDAQQPSVGSAQKATDNQVRLNLAKFGAPLGVHGETEVDLSLEETLVGAMALARHDATVARVLPVVFAKTRNLLNMRRLEFLARQDGLLSVLGFFLDLTASLIKSKRLHADAQRLKDKRRKRMENFFVDRNFNRFEAALTEINTPPVARRWNFLMNMGMDSFEDRFKRSFPESDLT